MDTKTNEKKIITNKMILEALEISVDKYKNIEEILKVGESKGLRIIKLKHCVFELDADNTECVKTFDIGSDSCALCRLFIGVDDPEPSWCNPCSACPLENCNNMNSRYRAFHGKLNELKGSDCAVNLEVRLLAKRMREHIEEKRNGFRILVKEEEEKDKEKYPIKDWVPGFCFYAGGYGKRMLIRDIEGSWCILDDKFCIKIGDTLNNLYQVYTQEPDFRPITKEEFLGLLYTFHIHPDSATAIEVRQ